jgi:CubicO group peptidase (beta-lactamase class C family)
MYKSFPLFFLSLLSFTISFGQNNPNEQLANSIDSLVLQQVKPNEPGLAILIAKKGKIVYEKAFGSANLELGVPLQPDMIFAIGSITKQFTAVAILQLVERGKISLQDSVQKYIKDFPYKGHTITIENLLTHTSGIKDFMTIDHPGQNVLRWDFTAQQIIDHFKNAPLEFKPGSKYNYTNSGYTLLGRIIEVASGKTYYNYLLGNVIKKAGLKNTFFANEDTLIPKRISSYTRDRGFYDNSDYLSISIGYGCGDLLSNVEDLFKWNTALLNGSVIKKETLEKAFTPYKLSDGTYTTYGYGWFIDNVGGVKRIRHEGQFMGFVSTEKYFPNEDIFVATLANVKSPEDKTDFSDKRYRLYENISLFAIDKKPVTSVSIAQKILDSYIGVYIAAFQKKRTFTIFKKDGQLFADFGPGNVFPLMPLSDTKFSLPDVIYKGFPTTFTFLKTNGITTKLITTQDKDYEWIKIK